MSRLCLVKLTILFLDYFNLRNPRIESLVENMVRTNRYVARKIERGRSGSDFSLLRLGWRRRSRRWWRRCPADRCSKSRSPAGSDHEERRDGHNSGYQGTGYVDSICVPETGCGGRSWEVAGLLKQHARLCEVEIVGYQCSIESVRGGRHRTGYPWLAVTV